MTNLTLAVDDDILRQARIRAVGEDTSVNACVRGFLERYALGENLPGRQQQAVEKLIHLAEEVQSGGGLEGRAWGRDDLHER